MANLAVFVSGRGSNLRSIIDSCVSGELEGLARVGLVVATRADIAALEVAKSAGIDRFIYSKDIPIGSLLDALVQSSISFIALAGYLKMIEKEILERFAGRIVNIHPALLPAFGGKGMYGMKVHRAVIESGAQESGVSVHFVSEEYDAGAILAQEKVKLVEGETAESLSAKILEIEHELYPRVIAQALTLSK